MQDIIQGAVYITTMEVDNTLSGPVMVIRRYALLCTVKSILTANDTLNGAPSWVTFVTSSEETVDEYTNWSGANMLQAEEQRHIHTHVKGYLSS